MLAICLAGCRLTMAAEIQTPLSSYGLDVWQTEHGLSHNSVRAITKTRDGRLWVATSRSLQQFNGADFRSVHNKEYSGHELTVLALRRDGGVVMGSLRGVFDVRPMPAPATWPTSDLNSVRSMAADGGDVLWVGTEYGLRKAVGTKIALQIGTVGQPAFRANALAPDGDGGVWIGTRAGVLHLVDGSPQAPAALKPLAHTGVRALLRDGSGNLWIGTDGDGLFRLAPNGILKRVGDHDPKFSNRIASLADGGDGALWIGTADRGLARFYRGEFDFRGPSEGLPHVEVAALLPDQDGSVWVGTRGGGLCRLRRSIARPAIPTPDGTPVAWAVAETPDGSRWVASDNGLTRIHLRTTRT
jgi:ligand-binding sensor domain-containing protein